MADCCAYGVLHCRLIGLDFKLHRFYEHIVSYSASPVWDCSTGSLRCGFWGVAKLGAERAGLLWKWKLQSFFWGWISCALGSSRLEYLRDSALVLVTLEASKDG